MERRPIGGDLGSSKVFQSGLLEGHSERVKVASDSGNSELEMALKLDSGLIIGVAPQPSIPTRCCLSLQLASRSLWQRFGSRKLGSRFVRNVNDWRLDMVVNILRDVQRELVTLVDDREQPKENKKGALNT